MPTPPFRAVPALLLAALLLLPATASAQTAEEPPNVANTVNGVLVIVNDASQPEDELAAVVPSNPFNPALPFIPGHWIPSALVPQTLSKLPRGAPAVPRSPVWTPSSRDLPSVSMPDPRVKGLEGLTPEELYRILDPTFRVADDTLNRRGPVLTDRPDQVVAQTLDRYAGVFARVFTPLVKEVDARAAEGFTFRAWLESVVQGFQDHPQDPYPSKAPPPVYGQELPFPPEPDPRVPLV